MFKKMFNKILLTFAISTAFANAAHSADSLFSFKDQRIGLGYLYLNQEVGGNVNTGDLIYDFNFLAHNQWQLNASALVTAYLDNESENTFWISAYHLVGGYRIGDSAFTAQVLTGFQVWDGRGVKFEYGLGAEYSLRDFVSLKQYIDSVFLQFGQINHKNDVRFLNVGLYKNF